MSARHQRWQRNNFESSRHLDDEVWRLHRRGPTEEEVRRACLPWKSRGMTKAQWDAMQNLRPATTEAEIQ